MLEQQNSDWFSSFDANVWPYVCAAVVYEVLYRGVFGLTAELEDAVTFIRQQKKPSLGNLGNNGKL